MQIIDTTARTNRTGANEVGYLSPLMTSLQKPTQPSQICRSSDGVIKRDTEQCTHSWKSRMLVRWCVNDLAESEAFSGFALCLIPAHKGTSLYKKKKKSQ